jgi:hypothetical protein
VLWRLHLRQHHRKSNTLHLNLPQLLSRLLLSQLILSQVLQRRSLNLLRLLYRHPRLLQLLHRFQLLHRLKRSRS